MQQTWFCQGSALMSLSTHTKPPQRTTRTVICRNFQVKLSLAWFALLSAMSRPSLGWVPTQILPLLLRELGNRIFKECGYVPQLSGYAKQERRAIGAIIRNFISHPHVGLGQVFRPVWKYVMGMAGGQQNWEKKGERAKGWGAQSSALPAASPLWMCSPPHPKYQWKRKTGRHCSVSSSCCPAKLEAELCIWPRETWKQSKAWLGREFWLDWSGYWSCAGVDWGQLHRMEQGTSPDRIFLTISQDVDPAQQPEKKTDGSTGISIVVAFWAVEK